jgi:cell division protein FtsI/penicillin-binding protein 2
MQALVSDPAATVAPDLKTATDGLHASAAHFTLDGLVQDPDDKDKVTANYTAVFTLGTLGDWTYQNHLPVVVTANGPRVVWSLTAVHPSLTAGRKLDRPRPKRDPRAPILGNNDQVLVQPGATITVGIEPQKVTDPTGTSRTLVAELDIGPNAVTTALATPDAKAHPGNFIAIITVRRDVYDKHKAAIYSLPGVSFREGTERTTASAGLARQVLGHTGPITAELLTKLGPDYQSTDVVGLDGLELAFERSLAGTPGSEVRVVNEKGESVESLLKFPGTAPVPLHTTLDLATQQAAEAALAGVPGNAALVAVDGAGKVRAAVSKHDKGLNIAFTGQYPPGSTFKVITSEALLTSGLTPDSPMTCPPTVTVGGRVFKNFENETKVQLNFTDAFADSCNTAFIGAAQKLGATQLADAARRFGFDTSYRIGLDTGRATFPPTKSEDQAAAAAIGQSEIIASPLHMATVAATVMSGQWHAPVLITDPVGPAPGAATTPGSAAGATGTAGPQPEPLDAVHKTQLRAFMQQVVMRGTGTAAKVPGQDVVGKTGTAEFGTVPPLATHAWFIGFSNDLAVAVIVEGGGVGGDVAAPLVSKFFAGVKK